MTFHKKCQKMFLKNLTGYYEFQQSTCMFWPKKNLLGKYCQINRRMIELINCLENTFIITHEQY